MRDRKESQGQCGRRVSLREHIGASGAGVTLPPDNSTGIYKSCADAPSSAPSCLTVGGVKDTYGIGEFEITVSQYVTFLNTVDPAGKNLRQLYEDHMNPTVWPRYGSMFQPRTSS